MVSVLLLLAVGKAQASWVLTKGNVVFCVMLTVVTVALGLIHRLLRIDDDSNFTAYLYSNAVVAGVMVAGWSGFVAIGVRDWAADAALWKAAVLYLVGLISVYGGYTSVSGYYGGSVYRYLNLPIAFGSFILFALWPAAGWALFGWFCALIGSGR